MMDYHGKASSIKNEFQFYIDEEVQALALSSLNAHAMLGNLICFIFNYILDGVVKKLRTEVICVIGFVECKQGCAGHSQKLLSRSANTC